MSNARPLVSICTPCYNHSRYLRDYFESIINQTYENIELIMIDDASSDDSVQIIEQYITRLEKRFVRVCFGVNEKNQGVVTSVNKLINTMQGKYCKLLASDDMLKEDAIEKMVDYLEARSEINVCMANAYVVPDDYRYGDSITRKYRKYYKKDISEKLNDKDKLFEISLERNLLFAPGVMMNSIIYKKYGLYDERMRFEDYEFWLRICKQEKIGYIDTCLVYYRLAHTSISNYTAGEKRKYENMMIGNMQCRIKHGRRLGEKRYKEFLKKKFCTEIEYCLECGYTDIAIKLYNTAIRMDLEIEYGLLRIISESIQGKIQNNY